MKDLEKRLLEENSKFENAINGQYMVSLDDYVDKLPDIYPFIVEPIISNNSRTIVYGKSGCGKSFFVSSLAVAVASGYKSTFGFDVKQSHPVLLIDGEQNSMDIKTRFTITSSKNPNIYVFERSNGIIDLLNPRTQEKIQSCVDRKSIGMVVFDNLSCLTFGQDENLSSYMTSLTPFFNSLPCASLIVAHSNKQGFLRGTSQLHNGSSTVIRLESSVSSGVHFSVNVEKCRSSSMEIPKVSWELKKCSSGGYSWVSHVDGNRTRIQELHTLGKCNSEIALELGISKQAVGQTLKKLGLGKK